MTYNDFLVKNPSKARPGDIVPPIIVDTDFKDVTDIYGVCIKGNLFLTFQFVRSSIKPLKIYRSSFDEPYEIGETL